ncbi:zinc finger and SCAN domain-containing protein 26-like [Ctenocephalides felis]|uniref:zinc finger and SCAN domain-containing protein 26-like n=1 Tax=Ctenocephalides felis TaxID=7515 RepID=UPI000E6E3EFF|nr:zinc finger and SCAN domain-containing protein 26-like [Ctenocephalides felis]
MNDNTKSKPMVKCELLAQQLQEKLEEHIEGINLRIEDIQVMNVSQGEPLVEADYRAIETVHINVDSQQAVQNYKIGRLPNLIRDLIREVASNIPNKKMTVMIDVAQTKNNISIPNFTIIYQGAYDPKLQAPLQCMVCNQSFEEREDFITHKKMHYEYSKFKCLICQKTFSYLNTPNQHYRMHSNTYDCNICDKSFLKMSELTAHRRAHKGVYKCLYCPASFIKLDNFRKHWYCHTSEKPHKCELCRRSYQWRSSYNRHIKSESHLDKLKSIETRNKEEK